MDLRQSLKRVWALRSDWKEEVRCSSSVSSCFLSWLSCGSESVARSTARSQLLAVEARRGGAPIWPPLSLEEAIAGKLVCGGAGDEVVLRFWPSHGGESPDSPQLSFLRAACPPLPRPARAMSLKWKLVRPIEGVRYNNRVTAELANQPRLLPHSQFSNIDAIYRWFRPVSPKAGRHVLNTASLRPFADTAVPLEYTGPDPTGASAKLFKRFDAPLGVFLDYIENPPEHVRMYLAQCSLKSLPPPMRQSLPLPDFLRTHGARKTKSALDIYDTSLWIGLPPTYTPLHRDPNPNCFFQMAGRKTIRLLPPEKGLELFQKVKKRIGEDGGDLSGRMRGEEMMMGRERDELEREVWDTDYSPESGGLEARLERGYGLFIPEGWWHSVKGHGTTITASVSALGTSSRHRLGTNCANR